MSVLLGNGNGTFQAAVNYAAGTHPQSVAVGDFNGDGRADLAVASYGSNNVSILLGTSGTRFVPITPCRVLDTRNAAGPFGGPFLAGGQSRSFALPQGACGLPSSAQAYSLNLTVVPHGPLGFVTIWPTGQTQPNVSTLNSYDGRIKANAAIVPAGTSGAVSVYASEATDVLLDVNGYFTDDQSQLQFYPVAPCRVTDTRLSGGAIAAGATRTVGVQCGIPSNAQAYALNVTALPQSGSLYFLTAWPTGSVQPHVSTLNATTGTVTANAAILPAGTGGQVNFYATDATHLVVDINGYFAPAGTGGLNFYTLAPCRVVDTRNAAGLLGGPILNPAVAGTDPRSFTVTASGCSVPSAPAYSLNATVVPSGAMGWLTLWPSASVQPWVSTLNAYDGAIASNAAIVPSSNGSVSAYTSEASHLILDINGYFGN